MQRIFSWRRQPREASPDPAPAGGISRRLFLKGLGSSAVGAAALGHGSLAHGMAETEPVLGPGAVSVSFTVNGQLRTFLVEPRHTLLEVLRGQAGLTGAKESCDRATCGACTVLRDGEPVYACSLLAIEAQDTHIETIEGLAPDGRLTALQQAFVDRDGLQCGFCSPGMIMVLTALLRKNPHPTEAEVRAAVAGNLCRCGSYPHLFAAALTAGGAPPAATLTILDPFDHGLA